MPGLTSVFSPARINQPGQVRYLCSDVRLLLSNIPPLSSRISTTSTLVLMQMHSVLRAAHVSGCLCHPPACDPLSEMPAGAVGLNIVMATMIFDREALTGSTMNSLLHGAERRSGNLLLLGCLGSHHHCWRQQPVRSMQAQHVTGEARKA